MSILAIATEFNRLVKSKSGPISDDYNVQLNVELFRDTVSNIFNNEMLKLKIEVLTEYSVDSKEFVDYIKTKIINLDYSFLPSGINREDTLCICSATLKNDYKIIGTFVCQKGKYVKKTMENRAFDDVLDKLKTLERYYLMNKLFEVNDKINNLRMVKMDIERNLINLIKNNKVIIPIVF